MDREQKEQIARNAASTWCRCYKCDGIVNATGFKCDKKKQATCRKWYDGYRTAMLALGEYEEHLKKEAVEADCSTLLYSSGDEVRYAVQYPIGKRPFNEGDKAKIVVLKD